MRKLAIAMVLASTALAGPAIARDKAWYIGVEGGAMIVEDMSYKLRGTNTEAMRVDSATGFDVDGIIGYDFGMFRLEAEVGYKRSEADKLRNSVPFGGTAIGSYDATVSGRTSALSFMVNGLLDFGQDDGISGYVGGGVGVARIKAVAITVFPRTVIEDSDTGFAYQAIAGVRFPITTNIDLGLKYRFFNAEGVNVTARNGVGLDTRYRSHSLLASLVYNFGEPAAPPPPP